jgi:hypothetical protein
VEAAAGKELIIPNQQAMHKGSKLETWDVLLLSEMIVRKAKILLKRFSLYSTSWK